MARKAAKKNQVQPHGQGQKSKKVRKPRANPGQGLFSALGGMGGGYLGGPMGSILGAKAGDLLSKITGFGDYTVGKNTLVEGNSVPTFRLASEGVEVSHREYLQDVTGSTAFSITAMDINPGVETSFPWLSQLAQNFEEYEMLGLVYEYRPSSGSAVSAASAALGVVIYATDYNALAPNFVNKQQMESYEFSCSTVPFQGMLHPVECARHSNAMDTLFVRNGPVPANADARMYDMGSFQFASQGMQSAYAVGELWVSYHVRLKKPRIGSYLGSYARITEKVASTASAAAPFGTDATSFSRLSAGSNLLGVVCTDPTYFSLQQPGTYIISAAFNGGATTVATFTRGANVSAVNLFLNETTDTVSTVSAGNSTSVVAVQVSTAGTGAANRITVTGLVTYAAGRTTLIVQKLPNIPS